MKGYYFIKQKIHETTLFLGTLFILEDLKLTKKMAGACKCFGIDLNSGCSGMIKLGT